MWKKSLMLLALLGVAGVANADAPHKRVVHERIIVIRHAPGPQVVRGVDKIARTQMQQQQQIRVGVRRGQLTREEARRLWREQERIADMKRRYTADGRLTLAEMRKLESALNRAQQRIYNERRDRQTRV